VENSKGKFMISSKSPIQIRPGHFIDSLMRYKYLVDKHGGTGGKRKRDEIGELFIH